MQLGPRRLEHLRRRAECDPARLGASGRDQREARMLALLAHRSDVLEAGRGHKQGGLRVAHAERPQALELLGELEAQQPARDDGVDALAGHQVVGRERGRRVGRQRAPERLHRLRLELHAGGHAMASEAREVLRTGREARVQVVGGHAAAGPPPGAVLERDHHTGTPPALHEPGRHDPHHARVPALPRDHDRAGGGLGLRLGLGGEQDAGLGLLAVAVEQVELAGHLGGARGVAGEKQLERGVGPAHPTRGVDARAEPEAERVLRDLGGLDARDLQAAPAGPACACARAPRAPAARCAGSRREAGRGRTPWRARPGRGPPPRRVDRPRRLREAPRRASARRRRRTAPDSRSRPAPGAPPRSRAAPRRGGDGP